MKQLLLAAMLACAALMPGCKTPANTTTTTVPVDPVVVAEKTIQSSMLTIKAFLKWEHANAATMPPDVTRFANKLRVETPDAYRVSQAVLRAYKSNRSPEQKVLLDTWVATMSELATQASKYYVK
jgi:type IV secretory pathway TrbF-like protein